MHAVAEVDLEMYIASAQVDKIPGLADGSSAAHLHPVEGDVDTLRLKVCSCCADGREYASPVGIVPKNSALEEIATSDRSAHLHCVLLRGRLLYVDGNCVGRSLRVAEQLPRQVTADLIQCSLEVPGCGSDAGCSAAHHDHRVVGGHTTVAVYPFEAAPAGARQLIMSTTTYLQKGGPAGWTPRLASQSKTWPVNGGTTEPNWSMLTLTGIAA